MPRGQALGVGVRHLLIINKIYQTHTHTRAHTHDPYTKQLSMDQKKR